jgi:hypothetical protein
MANLSANTITAFLETLTAAAGDYNAAKVGTLSFLKGVYLDVKPEVARNGQTIQVYFPDLGPFADQKANQWTPEAINPNYVDVVFNQRPGKMIAVYDFDQWQTSTEIIEKFVDPMYKRGSEYFNSQLAGQVTTANFNVYPAIQGNTPAEIVPRDLSRAWNNLAGKKVPLENSDDLSLFVHNDVYSNMFPDTTWAQESLVGVEIAQLARRQARLGVQFQFNTRWDQQAPKTYPTEPGTIAATTGSAAIVGSSTTFTTTAVAGSTVVFAGDATQSPYTVSSVTDNTHLTLTTNYTGAALTASAWSSSAPPGTVAITTGTAAVTGTSTTFSTTAPVYGNIIFAGDPTQTPYRVSAVGGNTSLTLATNYTGPTLTASTYTIATYTSLVMHRYAMALALRPLELVNDGTTQSRIIMVNGIPFRVMVSYQHLYSAHVLSVDCGCAVAVLRPDFGSIVLN